VGSQDFDVVIVGAGAAGCAAAISLPAGMKVLLIDRAGPGARRCCGGLLAPDGQAALAALGLIIPPTVRVLPEPRIVRVHDLDSGLQQTYRRTYWNLDRARFDTWLLRTATQRVRFRPQTRLVGVEREAAGLSVRFSHDGREETVRAHHLIGADGAGSAARRAAFPQQPGPPTMLAMQVRLPVEQVDAEDAAPAAHVVLFAGRLTDFYAWAIPKPDTMLVGCAFGVARGARQRFQEVVAWYRTTLGLTGAVEETSARRLSRPRGRRDLFGGDSAILLAGEAAGLVSPSSGEGLSFALDSGAAAGRALAARDPAAVYAATFRRLAGRVARKCIKARVVFSPGWRRWALRLPWCP
jgi:flavin-dependent dehydrogenase